MIHRTQSSPAIASRPRRERGKKSHAHRILNRLWVRLIGATSTCEQPHATHIPVLIGIAAACHPKHLIEFGSGNFSTLAFLDETAFPSLSLIESYENDPVWMGQMEEKLAGNPRMAYRFFEGRMRDAVCRANLAEADLIFIDDSSDSWERAHTIREVTPACGERAIAIVHDYELPAIRFACRKFEHRFIFPMFTPQTCAAWNGDARRKQIMDRVARKIEENNTTLKVTDVSGWANAFRG